MKLGTDANYDSEGIARLAGNDAPAIRQDRPHSREKLVLPARSLNCEARVITGGSTTPATPKAPSTVVDNSCRFTQLRGSAVCLILKLRIHPRVELLKSLV